MNYGAMVAVIGHETSHGFDDQGRQYDAKGNLRDWWQPSDVAKHKAEAQTVVDRFNAYTVVDSATKVNGQLTLGENIADLGGLTIACAAMQKAYEGKSRETIDGFTPEQRFFLGWAQVWRTLQRDEAARTHTRVHGEGARSRRPRPLLPCRDVHPQRRASGVRRTAPRRTVTHPDASPPAGAVTGLRHRMHAGDRAAMDQLPPLVYDELCAAARRALSREQTGHTLNPTDLVHEAWLKLAGGAGGAGGDWHDPAHFHGVAARAMRQVLVEQARRRLASKRGGGARHVTLGDDVAARPRDDEQLVALDDALERLEAVQPRLRALVEHRYFDGRSERETAALLGVSVRTVQRDWARARAWLHRHLASSAGA